MQQESPECTVNCESSIGGLGGNVKKKGIYVPLIYAKGGEIFVLDMGEPVRIYDLAVNLIKLKGFVPDKEIKVKITGLRPGEKLYEEVLIQEEGLEKTHNDLIFIDKLPEIDNERFQTSLQSLLTEAEKNSDTIISRLVEVCETYQGQLNSQKNIGPVG